MLNVPVLPAAAATLTDVGETESVGPPGVHRLLAVEPVPVGNVEEVARFILSSCAPSSRYAKVSV